MEMSEFNSLPLIDDDQIEMLVEAGEDAAAELIQELLDLFKSESTPHLQTLKDALAELDFTTASKVAHALAGSSANLGGLRLAKVAKAIEHAADVNDGNRMRLLAMHLDALLTETIKGFEAEISRIQSAVL